MQDERLWSMWQRSKMTAKHSNFFGKGNTKAPDGKVVSKYWWIGRLAFGWYTPLDLAQVTGATNAQKTNAS